MLGVLGHGSFGQVVHVRCKESGTEYAVKRALRTFETSGKRYRQLQEALNHELISPHPNIVRFEKAWEERGRFYIQTELCGPNLHEYREHYGPLLAEEQRMVFEDMLKALQRLHSMEMLHLDVKPSNIYLALNGRSCKLGDFGLAVNLKKKTADWADEGDKNYMAPELLNGTPTFAADLYSLGITVLEMSTDIDIDAIKDKIHSGRLPKTYFKGVPTSIRSQIISLLARDPKKRPSAGDALKTLERAGHERTVFRELKKVISPIDKDCFLDKDWDFESEDVIHPPSLRNKRKYDCTASGASPLRRRLVFDELDEDELPSPKSDTSSVGCNAPVFTRILEFNGSPVSPPTKKARGKAAA